LIKLQSDVADSDFLPVNTVWVCSGKATNDVSLRLLIALLTLDQRLVSGRDNRSRNTASSNSVKAAIAAKLRTRCQVFQRDS